MSLTSDPWCDDHLGRILREGLAPIRDAEPDFAVWGRIADAIEPPACTTSRIQGFVTRIGSSLLGDSSGLGWRGDGPVWVSLRGATITSLLLVAVLAIGGIGSGSSSSPLGGRWRITPTKGNPHDLATAELAIQRELEPRAVDRTLPGGSAPEIWPSSSPRERGDSRHGLPPQREAFNRSVWLQPAPAPRSSPVTPLEFLNGQ